jgi:integrase
MLIRPWRFSSPLAAECLAFLEFKRARGYRYERADFMLRSFDRFLVTHWTEPMSDEALPELILRWLGRKDGRKPLSVTCELAVIREFCRFRRRGDSNAWVPGRNWLARPPETEFLPYLFTEEEIQRILACASAIPGAPLQPAALRALILVLYCTGLRPGEAVRLRDADVDLKAAIFSIRESKGRSRLVPFGADLLEELVRYLEVRNHSCQPVSPGAFFVTSNGAAMTIPGASGLLRSLFRGMGLKPSHGRVGPRPYDFRHSFAVQRLTRWYREGVDIHAKFPWLSAYMGHLDLLGTESYLRATPELMTLAANRFEARFKRGEVER